MHWCSLLMTLIAPRSTCRKASGGVIVFEGLVETPSPPASKRTIIFVDGQNLFNAVKEAFGYFYPNYNIVTLAHWVCPAHEWQSQEVRLYTGLPDSSDPRHAFWAATNSAMGNRVFMSVPVNYDTGIK